MRNDAANVATVNVETDYVPNVVQAENGSAGAEALKAQAVAARTFLYYKMNLQGYIGDGENDQVYSNGSPPSAAHRAAALATEREVLRYGNGTNDATIAAFYVAGKRPDPTTGIAPFGVAEDGDGPTNTGAQTTEQYVTYNRGLAGENITQTTLGFVSNPPSGNRFNRGAMSQNGGDFLSDNGWNYRDILRFYYGADIHLEVARTPASGTRPGVKAIEGFDVDLGYFNDIIRSGRNANVAAATTARVASGTRTGAGAKQVAVDGNDGLRFSFYDLSGLGPNSVTDAGETGGGQANGQVANAATNLSMESIGSVGFWLKATAPAGADLTVSLLVDDDAGGIEAGRTLSVIADGTYRRYQWLLDDAADWNNFASGNGEVNGGYFSIDSIRFTGLADATFTYDDVFYDAAAVVPEPTTLAALAAVGLVARRRRRA